MSLKFLLDAKHLWSCSEVHGMARAAYTLLALCLALLLVAPSAATAQQACVSLKSLVLPSASVEAAEIVPPAAAHAGAVPGAPPVPATPEYCRVKVLATPTPDSKIGFELWMPTKDWNGKFLQVGNGGLGGSIVTAALAQGVSHNFAVASTDDGHTGSGVDGSWALGHPEKVVDFGYRAVHETSVKSHLLIKQFYSAQPKFAYFSGCSEGGREAMMEAQRYPEDFNGILAGAPAADWTGIMFGFAWNAQALMKDHASYIPPAKRATIAAAALKACGSRDGVTDPFIKDPLSCHFDPTPLLCTGADADSCLTAPQLTALKKIYSGAVDSLTGNELYPGYEPGPEAEPGAPGLSYASYIYGTPLPPSLDLIFSSSFLGAAVVDDAKYSSLAFDFGKDVATAKAKVGASLNATSPELKTFKARGGKLIHYHGWYDGSPAPQSSVDYYRAVNSAMGGLKSTQDFYRLFMVPGMMHCGQGPGPNSFGNMTDTSGLMDPEHNIFSALQVWVEQGRPPESVVATKYPGDDSSKPAAITRPLCPFPQQAVWKGRGSTTDAKSFACSSRTR